MVYMFIIVCVRPVSQHIFSVISNYRIIILIIGSKKVNKKLLHETI